MEFMHNNHVLERESQSLLRTIVKWKCTYILTFNHSIQTCLVNCKTDNITTKQLLTLHGMPVDKPAASFVLVQLCIQTCIRSKKILKQCYNIIIIAETIVTLSSHVTQTEHEIKIFVVEPRCTIHDSFSLIIFVDKLFLTNKS